MTVGIIGGGFVGGALRCGFENFCETRVYDIDSGLATHSLSEVIDGSEYIFICVPTPMNTSDHGKADDRIILGVLDDITKIIPPDNTKIVIIKSSVPPGSMEKFSDLYPNLHLVFNPEFLTEKNARDDFINADRIVVGGDRQNTCKVAELYAKRFPNTPIIETDILTAQFIKYLANCFFAVKVSYMNEMYQLAEKLGVDWEKALEGLATDKRVGQSHLSVPGPDGEFGFGGKCFPKDMNALINVMKSLDISPLVLEASWLKNLEVRKNKDWESILGAISK